MNRGAITSAKRVVIKIGSSSLTGSAGSELDPHAVQKVVDLAISLKKRGAEVVVVSSGAIAAGLAPLGLTTRPKDLAYIKQNVDGITECDKLINPIVKF